MQIHHNLLGHHFHHTKCATHTHIVNDWLFFALSFSIFRSVLQHRTHRLSNSAARAKFCARMAYKCGATGMASEHILPSEAQEAASG